MYFIPDSRIDELINEDLQLMDMTVLALGIEDVRGAVLCFPKQECTVAGVEEAARIFRRCDAAAHIIKPSGSRAAAGEVILKAEGSAGALHACYKTAQNVMEYCSGIATRTADMAAAAKAAAPGVSVAVTRKHFPGAKTLSVKAALAGGAAPHRLGLSDSILVFDQHRIFTDDFPALIKRMKAEFPEKKIEAEAANAEEGLAFVRAGADAVQCERFTPAELSGFVREAKNIAPGVVIAAAGGVNASNAAEYAAAGADVLVTSWVYFGKPQDIKMQFIRK